MRVVRRVLKWTALTVLLLIGSVVGWCFYILLASQPRLSGELLVSGLESRVLVARDAAGIPVVHARNRRDAAFATGFLHAQERFFQMDLARRIGAGELAELFGDNVLPIDREFRRHRLRSVAEEAAARLPDHHRSVLSAYVDGVNAGLSDLGRPPIEYTVTRTTPRPWTAADSILVILNMFILLQDHNGDQEFARHALYSTLPQEVADFLAVAGDPDWDAPLTGEPIGAPILPPPVVLSLRNFPEVAPIVGRDRGPVSGSNAWAMSGRFTSDGAGMLANDMHLGFAMPNTFYRVQLHIVLANDEKRRIVGVTLPGVPALVAGSNGDIAWGFTNSAGDYSDTVLLEEFDDEDDSFLSAQGRVSSEIIVETIRVHGGADEEFEISTTRWGPILSRNEGRIHYAIRWAAHFSDAVNLGLLDLESAQSTDVALALGSEIGIPAQNLIVVDRHGSVGWTIAGRLPVRDEGDGTLPSRSVTAGRLWTGWWPSEEYPRVVDPEGGRLWTANARVVDGEDLQKIGWGYYALGARARQIRDRLFELAAASERDMLALQMDHRAVFMKRWHALVLDVTSHAPQTAERIELANLIGSWDGTAARSSRAYPYVRRFRECVRDLVFSPFVAKIRERFPDFELNDVSDQFEAPLWRLVRERPEHLLPAGYSSWDDLLQAALEASVTDLDRGQRSGDRSWGEINRLSMRHPMSPFIPGFSWLFDMASVPLDGDRYMPLAQGASHGPVQRMVVRPGAEAEGSLTTPGGQSAHPFVAYYGVGHREWLNGEPAPLLAGPTVYRLKLVPR